MLVSDFLFFLKAVAEEKSLKGKSREMVEGTIKNLEYDLNG
jgi:hypothetical protein